MRQPAAVDKFVDSECGTLRHPAGCEDYRESRRASKPGSVERDATANLRGTAEAEDPLGLSARGGAVDVEGLQAGAIH